MRSVGLKPSIIGGGAILCSVKNKSLLVQKRSKNVVTHPEHYHIFGGSMDLGEDIDQTIRREIKEETEGFLVNDRFKLPDDYLFSLESSGFVQIIKLGIDVDIDISKNVPMPNEGSVVEIPLDQLRII